MLSVAALKACNSDPDCAKRYLYQVKSYVGASGTFTIEADGGTQREFVLKTVRGGNFVRKD
jgi:hypothetical protein